MNMGQLAERAVKALERIADADTKIVNESDDVAKWRESMLAESRKQTELVELHALMIHHSHVDARSTDRGGD